MIIAKLLTLAFTLLLAFIASVHGQNAKDVIDDSRSSQKTIANAPFSAEGVTESVQILVDGTRINRTSNMKVYRDSEGRYRRDESRKKLGISGDDVDIEGSIIILDPVLGFR